MYNGQMAMVSGRFLKSDMQLRYFDEILVKTNKSPDTVETAIKDRFKDDELSTMTLDKMVKMNNDANASLFAIFRFFSIMTMIIGVFGILNNFSISFMERKRWLAMMRAVGISKGQIIKMILAEAITGGIIGGVVGILTGALMISVIPYLLRAIDLPIPIHYSAMLLTNSLLGGIVVIVIASISPALKSSRLNIIEAVKYE
jgi:putative ABC transport system permease protein